MVTTLTEGGDVGDMADPEQDEQRPATATAATSRGWRRRRPPEHQEQQHDQRGLHADRLGPPQVLGRRPLDVGVDGGRPGDVERDPRAAGGAPAGTARRRPWPGRGRCELDRGVRLAAARRDHDPRRADHIRQAARAGVTVRRRAAASPVSATTSRYERGRSGNSCRSSSPACTASESWAMNPPDPRLSCRRGASGPRQSTRPAMRRAPTAAGCRSSHRAVRIPGTRAPG